MEERFEANMSLTTALLLGLTPLVIALLLYLSLSLCIQLSRWHSNWRLSQQLAIVRCSEECLIVSNPSIDCSDRQSCPEVV